MKEKPKGLNQELQEEFEQHLNKVNDTGLLSDDFYLKHLVKWLIRNLIAASLFHYFWGPVWLKWTCWVYIVLAVLTLTLPLIMRFFLSRKIKKTQNIIGKISDKVHNSSD